MTQKEKTGVRLKFKVQAYQTDAVYSTCEVFDGQPFNDGAIYRIDPGKLPDGVLDLLEDTGYRNAPFAISPDTILENIKMVQKMNHIPVSQKLVRGVAPVNLDIEMETGTGKTYVYIKTMFELNKRYGWSKFIVVVPSIAIREGVAESFTLLEDHFFEQYGKKIRWFVYNSDRLNDIQNYSENGNINTMIINNQAFAQSMKQGASNKASRIIYSEQDKFKSRRPIDVIAANNPIVILDEPQRLGGKATVEGIKQFNPLFALYYSATHREQHNCIYALDAIDAFRQKLVKRINTIGQYVSNPTPTAYISVKEIIAKKNIVKAKLEFQKKLTGERKVITFVTKDFEKGEDLKQESKLDLYDGYIITDISPEHQSVTFMNGKVLHVGDIIGDDSYREELQRSQIRSLIKAHFEKERDLFKRGIKCLSLIFIDFVSNYRSYDAEGNMVKGRLQRIFEEEYARAVEKEFHIWDEDYNEYLRQYRPQTVHSGYFSIDKNKRIVNTESDKEGDSEDREAFDRILRDKGWLLSMSPDSPRFIFSHSALREGWDNPNVFQICMLRETSNETSRRQEVGRGLRICVDRNGVRQDAELLGEDFFEINVLTVIANESFAEFSKALQNEIMQTLRERPTRVDDDYLRTFTNVELTTNAGTKRYVGNGDIEMLKAYLKINKYIDVNTNEPTDKYREASASNSLVPMPEDIEDLSDTFKKIVDAVIDRDLLKEMLNDITGQEKTEVNKLNENFNKEEFKALWNEINHKYVYTVTYDSDQLIEKAVNSINAHLNINRPMIVKEKGKQKVTEDNKVVFDKTASEPLTYFVEAPISDNTRYDLVGRLASQTHLTRHTIIQILKGIKPNQLHMFAWNPEQFISQVSNLIKAEKATMIVSHIEYSVTEGKYDSNIFTLKSRGDFAKAIKTKKHISDYVFFDSDVEKKFAEGLESGTEVAVYAKLPRTFQIPTPVGNYSPDWAIAFEHEGMKHIYFIAETKGTLDSMNIKPIEDAKIKCAKTLFNEYSDANVRYEHVDTFEELRKRLQKYMIES
ncbi:MAG: DEAD/DEAH box helicase family protein [Muribaculaceae bacterium]|nr:DEAD/DEAH box helicase family protein [Muribaculaceae bacterium]